MSNALAFGLGSGALKGRARKRRRIVGNTGAPDATVADSGDDSSSGKTDQDAADVATERERERDSPFGTRSPGENRLTGAGDGAAGKQGGGKSQLARLVERRQAIAASSLDEDGAYRADVAACPEAGTADDYARVPVESFGASMLKRMGWDGVAAAEGADVKKKGPVSRLTGDEAEVVPPVRRTEGKVAGDGGREVEVYERGAGKDETLVSARHVGVDGGRVRDFDAGGSSSRLSGEGRGNGRREGGRRDRSEGDRGREIRRRGEATVRGEDIPGERSMRGDGGRRGQDIPGERSLRGDGGRRREDEYQHRDNDGRRDSYRRGDDYRPRHGYNNDSRRGESLNRRGGEDSRGGEYHPHGEDRGLRADDYRRRDDFGRVHDTRRREADLHDRGERRNGASRPRDLRRTSEYERGQDFRR